MDPHRSLFEIARLLLSGEAEKRTLEVVVHRVVELSGADRGFVVVREGDAVERRYELGFPDLERAPASAAFSRSLVDTAMETRELVHSRHPREDPRFRDKKSVQAMRLCSVLVVPLHHGGEVFGAIYLEHPSAEGFGAEAESFVAELAEMAALYVRRALEVQRLERKRRDLERDLFARHGFEGIVTRDRRMIALLEMVAQVADSSASVLVRGETGTGKELIARALHVNGPRRTAPLVTLHCTALPSSVLESELFGHVRGAFTGADRDRPGRIAAAHGGTLFLDEVAEIPIEAQAKLLRFLQFGEIQRVGSDRVEHVDVRVVAATHRDLARRVEEGHFRQDLYYRLKVIELSLPPLRDRAGDVPLLVEHFTRAHWRRPDEQPRWTPAALAALAAHPYPGNVRELAHLMERACVLARGAGLGVELLPPELAAGAPVAPAVGLEALTAEGLEQARSAATLDVERRFLEALMIGAGNNVSLASRTSGIHRSYLQKLLARHRLRDG